MRSFGVGVAAFALAVGNAASAAAATGLTIRAGESWAFGVKNGSPVNARKVAADAKPAPGQIVVTMKRMMGTTLFATNNSKTAYSMRAELIVGGKKVAARACVIPANARPMFEQWVQNAEAVRLSEFRPTDAANCK